MRRSRRGSLAVAALLSLSVALVGASSAAAQPAAASPPAQPPAAPSKPTPPLPPPPADTLVPTPPMGFNDWNAFGCSVSAALIEQTADALVATGLRDLGYVNVNIDDCWSLRERDAEGRLVPDPVKFPEGIAAVADYVHSLGLKLGIYGDAGTQTCAGYPGSLGNELVDAQTWAAWGIDYLKYDNCHNQSDGSREDFVARYTAMRTALDAVDRPIVFSMCEWGQSQPWEWAAGIGDLWRTGGDVADNWPSLRSIIAFNSTLAEFAGPGHWNDPDMMEIGNGGMTAIEERTHFSMWAMMAAPLIIGTDLRAASPETLAILGNEEIIAIDQDRLGKQGTVISDQGGLMVMDKPLANGDHAIALYNASDSLATISVAASDVGLRRAEAYRLEDLWTGDVTQAKTTISAAVPAHGTVVYRVQEVRRHATSLAPSVTIDGSVGILVPGQATPATLDATVTNRGLGQITGVSVDVKGPQGWTVTATSATTAARLRTDASLATTWTVDVPAGTAAGSYPLVISATYQWGRHQAGTTTSEVIGTVVVAPGDGLWHLSTLPRVSSTNGLGPVETDKANGGENEGDGNLITIGGEVYTRGLGTHAASEIRYYLGAQCTSLTVDVGIDDEVTADGAATFRVLADDAVVADSGELGVADAAVTLTADLTGASWLTLVTDPGTGAPDGDNDKGDSTDWARPLLACGTATPADIPKPTERVLYSFESGVEGWAPVTPGLGDSVAQSIAFHTDGAAGLEVVAAQDGNWYGLNLDAPLDLTGMSVLKFDLLAGDTGSTGEFAVKSGDIWCQGGNWAWTNGSSSRTVTARLDQLGCGEVTLDLANIRGIYVFLNSGGTHYIDNIRAE